MRREPVRQSIGNGEYSRRRAHRIRKTDRENLPPLSRALCSLTNLTWLLLYLLVMGMAIGVLVESRRRALALQATPDSRRQWEVWVEEATRQSTGSGPVMRRPPASPEPPELILLRDHFPSCLLGTLVLTTSLFLTLMVLIRGAVGGKRFQPQLADRTSPRGKPWA